MTCYAAARMRIAASSSMQKLRGQAPKRTYPHNEGFLGEIMVKGSTDLGEHSYFGWFVIVILNYYPS